MKSATTTKNDPNGPTALHPDTMSLIDPKLVQKAEDRLEDVLGAIARVLERICKKNEAKPQASKLFTSNSKTSISIGNYCARLCNYMKCSMASFVCCVMYIDRICAKKPILLTFQNVHRMLLAALVTSIKTWDDTLYVNSYYAEVGGVPLKELNQLERDFLLTIEFQMQIKPEDFKLYFHHLTKCVLKSSPSKTTTSSSAAEPADKTDRAISRKESEMSTPPPRFGTHSQRHRSVSFSQTRARAHSISASEQGYSRTSERTFSMDEPDTARGRKFSSTCEGKRKFESDEQFYQSKMRTCSTSETIPETCRPGEERRVGQTTEGRRRFSMAVDTITESHSEAAAA